MNWDEMFPAGAPQPLMPGQQPAPRQAAPNDVIVRGPDGTENRFPVGTPQEAILQAMQQRYAGGASPYNPPGAVHTQTPLPGQDPAQSAARDLLPSLGTGIAQGAYELATLPATGLRLATGAANWVSEDLLGGQPLFPDNGLMQPVFDAQDRGRDWMAETLHQPTTTAGEFARTIGEFVPGAAALGPGNFLGNTVRYGVIPGALSETAGQITEGTDLEPWARVAAGLLGAGAGAIQASAGAGAGVPGATGVALGILARNLRGANITRAEIEAAEALVREAQSIGVPVTWIEAIHRSTNGRVDATMLQSFTESARGGQPVMSDFMAGRPAAAAAAAAREFPNIGASASPTALGQVGQEMADFYISRVREQINEVTRPLLREAEGATVDPIAFGRLYNEPLVQEAIREIRASNVYGREVAGFPDDSVAMMQALKVYFEDLASKASGDRINFAASVYGQQATAARQAGVDASPVYGDWLTNQTNLRRDYLAPLEGGPLGTIAGTDDLAAQTAALFQRNPSPGTAAEVGTAVRALVDVNPDAAASLVRSHVEQVFDQATRDLVRGENQFGPARFVAELRGNSEQAAVIEAALRALPDGAARWEGLDALMRVFEATGARLPPNSRTTFNTAMEGQSTGGTRLGSLGSLMLSPTKWPRAVSDFAADFRSGRNMAELARIITDPASGPLLRRLAMGGPLQDMVAVASTLIAQAGATAGGRNYDFEQPRLGSLIPPLSPAPAPVANVNRY